MRLRDLILMAGGVSTKAANVQVQITRQRPDGATQSLTANLAHAMQSDPQANHELQADDLVKVIEQATSISETETSQGSPAASAASDSLSSVEQLITGASAATEKPLRQFGYSLFNHTPSTFAPITDVPVGPDYVVGVGDELTIVLWGGVQETHQFAVDRNGMATLPRLGPMRISGLTMRQLEVFLQKRFAEFYSNFQLAVTLGKMRSIRIYVMGEVQLPGAYTVSALSTMLNALLASGGPTKNGSLRQIRLVRRGKTVHAFDLYAFLLHGDKSQDQNLQAGDTLFVPIIGAVAAVAGNVKRPAIYEIEPGTELRHLLDLAGGISPSAYLQRVHVERFVANERKVVADLNLSQDQKKTSKFWRTTMRDGDLVRIQAVDMGFNNAVELSGHVKRPGRYELKSGMRLHDLLASYEELLPEPYLPYAEIVRRMEASLKPVIIPFNLGALLAGDPAHNQVLQPRDLVRVFPKADFVDPPQVRISGLVHRPGIYPLTEGTRVRDLVMRAGNVRNFAYLEQAELTRRQQDTAGGQSVRREINLRRAMANDPTHNLLLQNFDHLLVRQQPDIELKVDINLPSTTNSAEFHPLIPDDEQGMAALQRAGAVVQHQVVIRGEVRFPGTYPILKGERLSSVLRRAGGYTEQAYLLGAVFTRVSVKEQQEKRFQEFLRGEEKALLAQSAAEATSALSPEEIQGERQAFAARRQLLAQLRAVEPEGRIVVQLGPLDTLAASDYDIELQPGDRLEIPQTPTYVSVLGQVYNPTALLYKPKRELSYYLDQVGGLKSEANEKEIHVVQVNGTVISNSQDEFLILRDDGSSTYLRDFFSVRLQPGDTIIVPQRVKSPASWRRTRDIVQIIFQSVSTLGIIAALL